MGGIIVVADTHFGIKKGSISMPGYFADFLRWIRELEKEKEKKVRILEGETPRDRTLTRPDKIIFLGDIIELWDSEDEAVNACVSTLIPTLTEIEAEKIYVLGNHDNILDKALLPQEKEYYPLGKSNLNTGLKYEKQKTRKAFKEWWEKHKQKRKIEESVNVVYGHTHFLNYIPAPEIDRTMYEFYQDMLKKRNISIEMEHGTNLINISSWIKDIKNKEKDEKYKNVMVASFLYIDEEGFEFFGWDWYEKRVFHIPKEVIIIRRETEKGIIPEAMAEKLAKIGWPQKLIDKWQRSVEL